MRRRRRCCDDEFAVDGVELRSTRSRNGREVLRPVLATTTLTTGRVDGTVATLMTAPFLRLSAARFAPARAISRTPMCAGSKASTRRASTAFGREQLALGTLLSPSEAAATIDFEGDRERISRHHGR